MQVEIWQIAAGLVTAVGGTLVAAVKATFARIDRVRAEHRADLAARDAEIARLNRDLIETAKELARSQNELERTRETVVRLREKLERQPGRSYSPTPRST